MKTLPWLLFAVILLLGGNATATIFLQENFSYTPGTLLTDTGNWASHSGAGSNAITVGSSGLSYPGYAASGNSVSMATSGEDDHTTAVFSHTSGAIYMAFLANFSAAQTGDYFIHFYQNSSQLYGRVFCRLSAGSLSFGVTHGAGTANYSATPFSLNTVHLIVVKYTMNPGTLNDTADLWIDPAVGPVEPAPLVSSTDTGSADGTNIVGASLRQGGAGSAPTVQVDGIALATSWAELFPTAPTGACCAPNGDCTLTTQANCAFEWHSDLTSCSPNPCQQPVRGACCLPDASCVLLTASECLIQNGAYQGDNTVCSPNPCPFPQRTLCDVAADDANGVALILGQRVEVEGVASLDNGIWSPTTNQFEISDGACCVSVFGDSLVPVLQGDLVRIRGSVGQFNGFTEMTSPDLEITVLSSGHPVHGPGLVTTGELAASGDNFEACLISIRCANITDGIWPAAGENSNLTIDDGSGPVTLRIDKDTDIDGTPQPSGPIDIVGIAYQFDASNPYTTGYQILPRSLADISPCAPPSGACCQPNGSCTVTTEAECLSPNVWQGEGAPCQPNPCITTGVEDRSPVSVLQMRAAPSPFSGQTKLTFAGPVGTQAALLIVDASGRKVRSAWAGTLNGRALSLVWDGRDDAGHEVASGAYLATLKTGSKTLVQRVIKAR